MGVREAVLAVAEGEINGRILASPDIPHKKLANARKGFITRADEVFLLVDDTVFGSGKDGLAITEKYIYAKQLFEIPKSIKISSIRSLEYESKRVNLDIYINNNLFLTLSSLERQDHDYLMAILQAAKEAATEGSLEPNQNEESPDIVEKDEVPTLSCDECNVELPPNAKFCLECGAKVLPKGVCLACDVKLPENAKFCPECGTPAGQQVEAKTSPTAGAGPQIDADQARNEISELLADAEQDVSIDSDGDLRIYFTTRGVPSFTSKLRGSAMSYSIKVMSEGEVAEDDSLSVNYSPDDDSISFGGPYLRVGKLPSAQYEIQIDASFWATTAVEIHEIKLKAGKIDAPSLGSSGISLSGLKATKDEGDGSYGVEYELKAYPNHYVHFDILSEKPEDDAILWPMLESDSTRSGTAWLYDIKPGDTFYLVFAEYEKIVDGITATLSGTAEPMEGAYDEANDAGRDGSSDALMEVCLRDVEGDEHIYWVEMGDLPDGEDEVDWAIEKARTYHTEHVGTEPAEDDEDDLPVTAYEPFDRSAEEYTLISSSRQYGGNAEESVVKLEFQIKRGVISQLDFDEDECGELKNCWALCKEGAYDEAAALLLPHLSFEWDWANGDGDANEYFIDPEPIYMQFDNENCSLMVGDVGDTLCLTASVSFTVRGRPRIDQDNLSRWLDENSMYACGYVEGGFSYDGSDGDNVWVVDIKGADLSAAAIGGGLYDKFEALQQIFFDYEDSLMEKGVLVGVAPESMMGCQLRPEIYSSEGEDLLKCTIVIETDQSISLSENQMEILSDYTSDWLWEKGLAESLASLGLERDVLEWWPVEFEVVNQADKVSPVAAEGAISISLQLVYNNADTGHSDEQIVSVETDNAEILKLITACLDEPSEDAFNTLFLKMYDNPGFGGMSGSPGALYSELWPLMSRWAFEKLGWGDVTVDVIGAVINGTDLGIDVETMDTNRWSLQLVRDEGMYCYY